ncbi:MAG TPA: endo alpha-1,4 polygalactosaminidase [Glaciihabitans sp.]|nr:endo alpha-1,4 polygalactosaminidase [Glaciihabitans sp.]
MKKYFSRLGIVAIAVIVMLLAQPIAASAGAKLPPANGVFDYQLGGAYKPAANVSIVVRDRTDSPAAGKYNICYVNGFQTQPGESASFAKKYPNLLVKGSNGKPIVDPDWPDEYLFDISTAAKRTQLSKIVGAWIDGCAKSGFRAVEADNLDSYTRSKGHLTQAHAIAFAKLLVARADKAGLAIGQKNGADFTKIGKNKIGFDFAVTEECQVYKECKAYTDVYGTQVYEVEYTDNGSKAYPAACKARGKTVSVIYRDRDLVPRGTSGYVYKFC